MNGRSTYTYSDLNAYNLTDIKRIASDLNINGRSRMRKAQLIDAIIQHQNTFNGNARRYSGNYSGSVSPRTYSTNNNGSNRRYSGNYSGSVSPRSYNGNGRYPNTVA